VVGFTEPIYYSEWEGYDTFTQPLRERRPSPETWIEL
jgi:hypothetical protein